MLTPILVWGHPLCGHCHAGARQWSSVTKCRSVLVAAAAGAQSGDLISNQIPAHGPTRPRVSLCFPSGRGKSRNHSASASLRRERNIYTSFSRHKRKLEDETAFAPFERSVTCDTITAHRVRSRGTYIHWSYRILCALQIGGLPVRFYYVVIGSASSIVDRGSVGTATSLDEEQPPRSTSEERERERAAPRPGTVQYSHRRA